MAQKRSESHTQQVEAWLSKNGSLSARERLQLFINGILAIRQRALGILSQVTVSVVVDRVLLECQERHPIMKPVTNDTRGLHFDQFTTLMYDENSAKVEHALRDLLLDLLEVFGKITADILTKNLHQELMTVTNQPSLALVTKNREQK